MSIAAGTRPGSYEILSQIGAGCTGEVYEARDTKLGRDVAIKIFLEAFARDLDRFQREAKMLASLNSTKKRVRWFRGSNAEACEHVHTNPSIFGFGQLGKLGLTEDQRRKVMHGSQDFKNLESNPSRS